MAESDGLRAHRALPEGHQRVAVGGVAKPAERAARRGERRVAPLGEHDNVVRRPQRCQDAVPGLVHDVHRRVRREEVLVLLRELAEPPHRGAALRRDDEPRPAVGAGEVPRDRVVLAEAGERGAELAGAEAVVPRGADVRQPAEEHRHIAGERAEEAVDARDQRPHQRKDDEVQPALPLAEGPPLLPDAPHREVEHPVQLRRALLAPRP
eukprot:gene9843-biopygen1675